MATIRDVAQIANVSVATVSRVLNGSSKVSDKAREAVLKAQKELDFVLNANARALAHQDSETIGIVVSDLSDPYFGLMVKYCENAARQSGNSLIVTQGFHDEQREIMAIDNLISRNCRGMIVHALRIDDEKLSHYMQKVPTMILINRTLKGFEERCLNIDNVSGYYLVGQELIKKGHKKIAFVGSSHTIADAAERLEGLKKALLENDIKMDESLIVLREPYLEGGFDAASELIEKMQQGHKFTAVACYNDYLAAGTMARLTEAGYKIPEDISVVGFDDLYLARCTNPPLTTVHHPVDQIACLAIEMSIALFKQKHIKKNHFDISLVQRKSVRDLSVAN